MNARRTLRMMILVSLIAACGLLSCCGHSPRSGERGFIRVSSDFHNNGEPTYLGRW